MDRSLFPQGVVVDQPDLERTEATKSFHILQRHLDNAIMGALTIGDIVTANIGDATLIDIAAFTGYAPNGEFVESTVVITGQQLSDYTNDIINLIVGMYTETNSDLKPHETDGTSKATSATRSIRIRVFTQAEFNALPATDSNLNNDAQDRALVVARVTAQGVGINLVPQNIEQVSIFGSALSAVNTTNNITGVSIIAIDRTTITGIGELAFDFVSPTEQNITWKAPGDGTPGPAQNISISGAFILTSSGDNTLTIQVSAGATPGSDVNDNITITNIYSQNVPRHTSEDLQHRSLIGSGTPTTTNPHGLTTEDLGISGDQVEAHQDLFHSNGILRNSAADVLATIVAGSPDEVIITQPVVGDSFYLNGIEHNAISPGIVSFSDITSDLQALFDIYIVEGISGLASINRVKRIEYDVVPTENGGANDIADALQLKDVARNVAILVGDTAEIFYDDTAKTLSFYISSDAGIGSSTAHVNAVSVPTGSATSLRLFNETGTTYIDVFSDILTNWALNGVSDKTEPLAISALPSAIDLESRLLITTAMFSGTSTKFVGVGFGGGTHAVNTITDKRLFGVTSLNDLRDDARLWLDSVSTDPNQTPAAVTSRDVGVGVTFPDADFKLHVVGTTGTSQSAILGIGGAGSFGDGVKGIAGGVGGGAGIHGTGGAGTGIGGTFFGGETSGDAIFAQALGSVGNGIFAEGIGAGFGGDFVGGISATSAVRAIAAGGSGSEGIEAIGDGTGAGVIGRAGAGAGAIGVFGQGSSTGAGVQGFSGGSGNAVEGIASSGTGYGVLAQGDNTNPPVRAAFRMVPQADDPTTSDQGALYTNSIDGTPTNFDGNQWRRTVGRVFAMQTDDAAIGASTTAEVKFPTDHRFDASTLRQGSTIRVRASGFISKTGSPDLTIRLRLSPAASPLTGAILGVSVFTLSGVNGRWTLDHITTVRGDPGAGIALAGTGSIIIEDPQTADTCNSTGATQATNVNNDLEVSAQFSVSDASNNITMTNFVVEVA